MKKDPQKNRYQIIWPDADFFVLMDEMILLSNYDFLVFTHQKKAGNVCVGSVYIRSAAEKRVGRQGVSLYKNVKKIRKILAEGDELSSGLLKMTAGISKAVLKKKNNQEIKEILNEYRLLTIPFFTMYGFADEVYSNMIGQVIRTFVFKKIKDKTVAAEIFSLMLNSSKEARIISDREAALKKIAAPKAIIDLCWSARETGVKKLFFRSVLNQIYGSLIAILGEIAARFYLSLEQARSCDCDEVFALLNGKNIDMDEVNKRTKCFIGLKSGGKIIFYTGPKAEKMIEKIEPKTGENIAELRGDPASAGVARGEVKIIPVVFDRGGEDLLKKKIKEMKKGEILVSRTTGPETIMACRKAAAIIADEGGINSHAAIISRELGIPGVVSVKIATRVLKDGDLVEVDGNTGIIKILAKRGR